MAALGTGVFGLAAVGLLGLGVQVLLGKLKSAVSPESSSQGVGKREYGMGNSRNF
jgi:hypothetical protein